MKLAFWLFLLLLVTNGLSAFLGNELGRKIGKRKLSIFALRPKHSSTFLTILLGMTLSLGAMGLWLSLDSGARTHLLFPENAAEQQLAHYQDHIATANRNLQRLRVQQAQQEITPAVETMPSAPVQLAQQPVAPTPPQRLTSPARSQVAVAPKPSATAIVRTPTSATAPPMRTARLAPPARIPSSSSPAMSSAPAPTSEANPLPVRLVAQQNDLLFSFEVPGAQSESASRAIVSEVLKMTEQYARELGVQDSSVHILPQELEQAMRQLQQPSAFALQIKVAQDTHPHQPLPIHLTLQSTGNDSFDPHDLLEKERLGGNETRAVLQQGMQEAIAQTIRQKQEQGLRVAEYKPTLPIEGTPFSAPVETWRNAEVPVRFSNVMRRNATIYGTITTQSSALNTLTDREIE